MCTYFLFQNEKWELKSMVVSRKIWKPLIEHSKIILDALLFINDKNLIIITNKLKNRIWTPQQLFNSMTSALHYYAEDTNLKKCILLLLSLFLQCNKHKPRDAVVNRKTRELLSLNKKLTSIQNQHTIKWRYNTQ